MAIAISLLAALAVVASLLPWTRYWDGGDSSPITISGLSFPAEWGLWTLVLGVAMMIGALMTMVFVSPYRYFLVAVPASGGLVVSAMSCIRLVPLDTGELVKGTVATGLALVVAAYAVALALTAIAGALDWFWRTDQQVITDY